MIQSAIWLSDRRVAGALMAHPEIQARKPLIFLDNLLQLDGTIIIHLFMAAMKRNK